MTNDNKVPIPFSRPEGTCGVTPCGNNAKSGSLYCARHTQIIQDLSILLPHLTWSIEDQEYRVGLIPVDKEGRSQAPNSPLWTPGRPT